MTEKPKPQPWTGKEYAKVLCAVVCEEFPSPEGQMKEFEITGLQSKGELLGNFKVTVEPI